jgi:hypothetical protein
MHAELVQLQQTQVMGALAFITGDAKQAGANGDAAAEDDADGEAPAAPQRRVLTAEELLAEAEEQANIEQVRVHD